MQLIMDPRIEGTAMIGNFTPLSLLLLSKNSPFSGTSGGNTRVMLLDLMALRNWGILGGE